MVPLILQPCAKTPGCVLENGHQATCKVRGGSGYNRSANPTAAEFHKSRWAWFITLNGERGQEWQGAVGTRTFPVTSIKPEPASVLGNVVMAYFLDLERLTPQLRDRIEHFLAERWRTPIDQVRAEIRTHGVPIIAKNLITPEGWRLGDED